MYIALWSCVWKSYIYAEIALHFSLALFLEHSCALELATACRRAVQTPAAPEVTDRDTLEHAQQREHREAMCKSHFYTAHSAHHIGSTGTFSLASLVSTYRSLPQTLLPSLQDMPMYELPPLKFRVPHTPLKPGDGHATLRQDDGCAEQVTPPLFPTSQPHPSCACWLRDPGEGHDRVVGMQTPAACCEDDSKPAKEEDDHGSLAEGESSTTPRCCAVARESPSRTCRHSLPGQQSVVREHCWLACRQFGLMQFPKLFVPFCLHVSPLRKEVGR